MSSYSYLVVDNPAHLCHTHDMEQTRKYGRGRARPAPMPVEDLRKMLAYNRQTGQLVWKECAVGGQGARRVKPGHAAGCRSVFGYIVIRVNQVLYPAHRLAWYLETGKWPPQQVDHINEVKSDNRWDNLRLATHAENTHYRHQARIARAAMPAAEPRVEFSAHVNGDMPATEIRRLIAYEPDTGAFTWRVDRGCNLNKRRAGDVAGGIRRDGYRVIRLGKRIYKAHRLAWAIMTGEWPNAEIDHINGIRSDNAWANLRLATRGQNQHNRAGNKPNKTGFRGVSPNGNGFKAQISIGGKIKAFPTRATAEEAYADYVAAAREHHGEFARFD